MLLFLKIPRLPDLYMVADLVSERFYTQANWLWVRLAPAGSYLRRKILSIGWGHCLSKTFFIAIYLGLVKLISGGVSGPMIINYTHKKLCKWL